MATPDDRERARAWLIQTFGYLMGPQWDLRLDSLARLLAEVRADERTKRRDSDAT